MRANGSNWPMRLDADAANIIALYKAGGVPVKILAATYRAREQDMREFLKHHGVFAYLRPNAAKTFKRVYEEKKKSLVDRMCLYCAKMFQSIGIGNRICRRCRSNEVFSGSCADGPPGGRL